MKGFSKLPEDKCVQELFDKMEFDLNSLLESNPPPMNNTEKGLVENAEQVLAIKAYRERTGLSLLVCKYKVVDVYRETLPFGHPASLKLPENS